jgi:DNA-binding winged helix-turn-helix (wHTH) protein
MKGGFDLMSAQTRHAGESCQIGETLFLVREGRLLDAAGKDIRLRAMSAKALALLVANAGRLVTKDHLVEKV